MVGRPARRPVRTTTVKSGRRRRRACAGSTSGGELVATLATAGGEDGAPGPGAHPQPEAVGLGPAAVVRLERALAHEGLPLTDDVGAVLPGSGRTRVRAQDGLVIRDRIRDRPCTRGWSAVDCRPVPVQADRT